MDLTCKIDSSGINRGIVFALLFTKRTPAQLVNTSGCEAAIVAKNTMPFTTIQRIDTELNLAVPLIGKKRGVGFRKGKKFQRENREVGDIAGTNVPLAVLIIQARANPGSKYNLSTNNRYALSASPFKGVSRAQGQALMRAAVTRMINSRHSSIKFLMNGWTPAVMDLLPLSVNRYRRGSSTGPPLEGKKNYYGSDLGGASPAQEGNPVAICVIMNNIGYEGKNAASFDHALQLYGAPWLQAALDGEGQKNMQYGLDNAKKELEADFNRAAG